MKRIKILKAYLIIWLFVLYVIYSNAELLGVFFMATVVFSSAIVGLLAVGTLYQFISGYGIMMLGGTFGALAYKKTDWEFYLKSIDSLLPANIAHMLRARKTQQKMLFTQEEAQNIIEWLESKFKKQKSYVNFFINTSMLVGLLGTFVGLVEAIDKMGEIILSLDGEVDIRQIMQDFAGPIGGMAIGFGASLFGVVSAVILGINGYVLFREQDKLIGGVEDWLKDRIIDVMPETLGRTTQGTVGAELPESRKSFMDIFLEQMTSFTHEIAGLTQSNKETNKNFYTMAESMSSMRNTIEVQKQTFDGIASVQEGYSRKFDTFLEYTRQRDKQSEQKSSEDGATIQMMLSAQSELLSQSATTLVALNGGMGELNSHMQTQQANKEKIFGWQQATHKQTHDTLVQLIENVEKGTEKTLAQSEEHHKNSINALTALSYTLDNNTTQMLSRNKEAKIEMLAALEKARVTILEHTDKTAELMGIQDGKLDAIITAFASNAKQLEALYSQIETSGHILMDMSASQANRFEDTLKAYSLMQDGLSKLEQTMQTQISSIGALYNQSSEEHNDMVEQNNATKTILESVSSTLVAARASLESLVHTEEIFKEESKEASQESLQAVARVETLLEDSKERLLTLISVQESLGESSLQQKKAFEEEYFKNSQVKQDEIVTKLSEKLAEQQKQLELMTQTLKNIETFVTNANFDKKDNSAHGGGVAEEIKGFFGSLFGTKNQEK